MVFKRLLLLGIISLMVISGYLFYSHHWYPPIPESIQKKLFDGITYILEVRQVPRPIVIHLVKVDLTHPNIGFLVTPGETMENGEIGARTTSQFLTEFRLQIAVNGSFFYPFHPLYSIDFWKAYPDEPGAPVYVLGFASSRGKVYSQPSSYFQTLYISADNQAQFQTPIGNIYNAISGKELLVKQGKIQEGPFSGKFSNIPYPRTALALDKTAKMLMIFVMDGKQKNYSEGVTLLELAKIIKDYGGEMALNLDGGGSSTLVMEGTTGTPIFLNSPINGRIPSNERLVANHLGIFVKKPLRFQSK